MKDYRKTRTGSKRTAKRKERERLPLYGLLWALILFLTLLLGKQMEPGRLRSAGERVLQVLEHNVDVEEVFSRLGESIAKPGGALEGLGEFCVSVFGPQEEQPEISAQETAVFKPILPSAQSRLLTGELEKMTLPEVGRCEEQAQCAETVPAVGTVLTAAGETEAALPEGYTADELSFGALETVAPVLGHLNSGFGYRDHPVNGKYSFHSGADISADAGDEIVAFADGVVEYVGEDSTYGRYLQLDHGDGIKSFYAHCQQVCVQKGESVTMGETVAIVGATGRATGPHLHLELKCCGVRVDPAYYIDFL